MNIVDIIILVLIVGSALHGFFRGAAVQIFSFAGFWGGLLLGAVLSPHVTSHIRNGLDRTVVAVVIVFGVAIILGGVGERVGSKIRTSLRVMLLGPLDSGVGAVIGVIATLLAVWLIAAMLLAVGNLPAISQPIAQSTIVKNLEKRLPPAPSVFARVGSVLANTGLPQVFANLTPPAPVTLPTPSSPQVADAVAAGAPSTVQVQGFGCGGIKSGSGFVVAPGVVVTNAHVVSGIALPEVYDRKGRHADVTVVLFDPEVDLAVLKVSGLTDKPLTLDTSDAPRGTEGAVLGYPGGGPFTYVPAVELDVLTAIGKDIYNRATTSRSVYELQAAVRPGNSGGPFMGSNGQVMGVVFSESTTYPNVGYALTGREVAPDINKALGLTSAVSTQTCSS